ncbi:MAG: carbonic anhydrase [Planctomycetaceae bacterium]|nr:carbonic anhydrase [Planctomycetaceae bacterium]
MRKTYVSIFLFFTALLTSGSICAADNPSHATADSVSPQEAIALLKTGNARFVSSQLVHPHKDRERILDTETNGQHPFVTILACSDSRLPLDTIFDQGIGDIFAVRVAGNVNGPAQIGSLEYGVEHTGAKLLVVLGHTKCGAVTAACTTSGENDGNLSPLLRAIRPAVRKMEQETGKSAKEIIDQCSKENVFLQIESIFKTSKILREESRKGNVQIVGAMYDIHTGKVEFYGQHPQTAALVKETE